MAIGKLDAHDATWVMLTQGVILPCPPTPRRSALREVISWARPYHDRIRVLSTLSVLLSPRPAATVPLIDRHLIASYVYLACIGPLSLFLSIFRIPIHLYSRPCR